MRLAPSGDVVVIVAVGDGAADHEQQDLRQRVRHLPRLARILDYGEMVQQGTKARFLTEGGSVRHDGSPNLAMQRITAKASRKPR